MIARQSNSAGPDCIEIGKGTAGSVGVIRVKELISGRISVEIFRREKFRRSNRCLWVLVLQRDKRLEGDYCRNVRIRRGESSRPIKRQEKCEDQFAQEKRRVPAERETRERDKVRVLEAGYLNQFVSKD
jgi:hypothetical protein